jgi:hypothetical protein
MFKKLIMLIIFHIIINLLFSGIYFGIGHKNFNGLDSNSSFLDYFYFSMTTSSCIGYGDISPSTNISKMIVIFHQLLVLLNIVRFIIPEENYNKLTNNESNVEMNDELNDSSSFENNDNLNLDKI